LIIEEAHGEHILTRLAGRMPGEPGMAALIPITALNLGVFHQYPGAGKDSSQKLMDLCLARNIRAVLTPAVYQTRGK
jgi:hypothetical protein